MSQSNVIAGLDEVGAGAWAGPLVIAVAAFPAEMGRNPLYRDSKVLSAAQREKAVPEILREASHLGFGFAGAERIDAVGLAEAWQEAARQAVEGLPAGALLIVDGDRPVQNFKGEQRVEPKADRNAWQVSAASIVAKVMRDREMRYLHDFYGHYDWLSNVGYGTAKHEAGLLAHGPSRLHRRSFLKKLPLRWEAKTKFKNEFEKQLHRMGAENLRAWLQR